MIAVRLPNGLLAHLPPGSSSERQVECAKHRDRCCQACPKLGRVARRDTVKRCAQAVLLGKGSQGVKLGKDLKSDLAERDHVRGCYLSAKLQPRVHRRNDVPTLIHDSHEGIFIPAGELTKTVLDGGVRLTYQALYRVAVRLSRLIP